MVWCFKDGWEVHKFSRFLILFLHCVIMKFENLHAKKNTTIFFILSFRRLSWHKLESLRCQKSNLQCFTQLNTTKSRKDGWKLPTSEIFIKIMSKILSSNHLIAILRLNELFRRRNSNIWSLPTIFKPQKCDCRRQLSKDGWRSHNKLLKYHRIFIKKF